MTRPNNQTTFAMCDTCRRITGTSSVVCLDLRRVQPLLSASGTAQLPADSRIAETLNAATVGRSAIFKPHRSSNSACSTKQFELRPVIRDAGGAKLLGRLANKTIKAGEPSRSTLRPLHKNRFRLGLATMNAKD